MEGAFRLSHPSLSFYGWGCQGPEGRSKLPKAPQHVASRMKGPLLARLTLGGLERLQGESCRVRSLGIPGFPPPLDILETGQLSDDTVFPPRLQLCTSVLSPGCPYRDRLGPVTACGALERLRRQELELWGRRGAGEMEVPGLAWPRGSRAQPWPGSCSQLLPPAGPSHVLSVSPSFGTAS